MSYALRVDDTGIRGIRNTMAGIAPNKRKTILSLMGAAAETITRDHIALLARSKHNTARALGAKQTGFYRDAVDAVRSYADTLDAKVIIDHPGFANARKEITITPIAGKFLTIPTHRMSYGKRAGEFDRSKTFVRHSGNGGLFIWYKPGNGRIIPLYRLATSVTKPMDENLLPPNEDYADASLVAFREYFKSLAEQNQVSLS